MSAWNEHIPFAHWIVEAAEPKTIAELGTHIGVSYFAFCEAVQRLGLAAECFAIDHWLGDKHSGTYSEDVFRSVNLLNEEHYAAFSRLLRLSFDDALSDFSDQSIDLLHIDGLHTYEAVKHDVEAWMPKLSHRGVILLHDTNERKADFGVFKLFAELRTEFPCFEFTHGHGLGVIGVGSDLPPKVKLLVELDDMDLTQLLRATYKGLGSRLTLRVERDQARHTNTEYEPQQAQLNRQLDQSAEENARLSKQLEQAAEENARSYDESAALEAELDDARNAAGKERRSRIKAESALEGKTSDLVRLRRLLEDSRTELSKTRQKYRRLRSRRSVRFALVLANAAAPAIALRRWTRGKRKPISTNGFSSDSSAESISEVAPATDSRSQTDQALLEQRVTSARPGSPRTEGPLVSIVILTRNGADHVSRLLLNLDSVTRYRSFEVIVVDNGSTDRTAEVLQPTRAFPLKVIRNDQNTSFSKGNNQGFSLSKGEFLLFLNNDVDPINPGWLGAMVDVLLGDESIVATGAELIYPVRGRPESDLTVQHAGTRFVFRDQAVRAENIGGADPLAQQFEGIVEVPAATAAALMVRASSFDTVGRFDEGYVYGTEDVDLCLRLGELGRVVVTGQAVLFHLESATQSQIAAATTRVNRIGNTQRFAERWGPRVTRSVKRERLGGQSVLTGQGDRTVAITLTNNDVELGWGDYYTAHGLGDAFEALGWRVIYAERYLGRWYEIDAEVDLLISLLDSYDVRKAPDGAITLAWVRNWAERWVRQPWFEAFDVVVASSKKGAEMLSARSRFDPSVVHMATDVDLFDAGPPNPTFESDYAFTGNNWGEGRELTRLINVYPDETFLLFGKGWDADPRVNRFWRGHLPHELLPDLYRSTKIILDDTAGPTKPYGFLNGRVFDALAAGALAITDNIDGSDEIFDGLLPTYTSRHDLREKLDIYLGDEELRVGLVSELRARVVSEHSYRSRPLDFLHAALSDLERPHAAIKIAVPDESVLHTWGDTHFANGMASALTGLGIPTEVHIMPEWDLPSNQAVDIVIHVRGLNSYMPKPAHINVLWIISHPDDVTIRECSKFDVVLVASRSHAEWLDSQVDVPIVFMPQATDSRRFSAVEPRNDLMSEVLFVGNSRGTDRPAVEWAIERGLPITVYGGGWGRRIPARYLRGDYFPNEDLAALYASSKVVLNDHWHDMRDNGFISNRIFDALASGAVVVSDGVSGLDEMFGDLVPTYSSPEDLEEVVRALLMDEERRSTISNSASMLVQKEHTFSRRAEQLVNLLRPLLAKRKGDLEGRLLDPSRIPADTR